MQAWRQNHVAIDLAGRKGEITKESSGAMALFHHRRRSKGGSRMVTDEQFERVAENVFSQHKRVWKPGTLAVNRSHLNNQILPWFRGRPIADITATDVRRWFASLHSTPAAANRSLPVLSRIMRQAEKSGLRPENSNPCRGIRRFPQIRKERFLTLEETRRLGAAFDALETDSPLAVAVILLLALTGCRQSEIRTLDWRDYREGHLFLRDSKTGPRTVWLSSAAREVLEHLPQTCRWIFPAQHGKLPLSVHELYRCWEAIRLHSDLGRLRLHDLRHSYASFALRQGETILTIGRLLGHRDPETTLRYTHFGDAMAQRAVEAVGTIVGA